MGVRIFLDQAHAAKAWVGLPLKTKKIATHACGVQYEMVYSNTIALVSTRVHGTFIDHSALALVGTTSTTWGNTKLTQGQHCCQSRLPNGQ